MNLLDDEGYPTEEFLKFIENYKPQETPIMELVSMLEETWWGGDMGFKLHRKYSGVRKLELHTLGWSGNEEIIDAIKENIYLTHFTMKYQKWITGGHYYFEVKID